MATRLKSPKFLGCFFLGITWIFAVSMVSKCQHGVFQGFVKDIAQFRSKALDGTDNTRVSVSPDNSHTIDGQGSMRTDGWELDVVPVQHGQRTIPKIIHQIWNDEIVPGEFVKNIQGLVRDNPHPEWKYYFWTKDLGLKFIKQKYPYLYDRANDTNNLLRSDLLRYLVIYEYGGVYFDLDTVSVKPLDRFVDSHRCSLALEPAEHYFAAKGRDFLLSNGALFCVRRHPFFTNLLLHLTGNLKKRCQFANSCTGPHMLSWLYRELNKTDNYAAELPVIQRSEVFQDVYDHGLQRNRLQTNCFNNTELLPFQKQICVNWIARGKEKRNLSESALTYHTWFHIGNRRLNVNKTNHVINVVPHAMLYGKGF